MSYKTKVMKNKNKVMNCVTDKTTPLSLKVEQILKYDNIGFVTHGNILKSNLFIKDMKQSVFSS